MNWEQVKAEFEWDGTLRDLYILGTDVKVWERVIDFLRASEYACRFQLNEDELPLPVDVAELFKTRSEVYVMLSVNAAGITINCHFFGEDEVEFDIDPREIDSEAALEGLFSFMRRISRAAGQPIRLTPENGRHFVIWEYFP